MKAKKAMAGILVALSFGVSAEVASAEQVEDVISTEQRDYKFDDAEVVNALIFGMGPMSSALEGSQDTSLSADDANADDESRKFIEHSGDAINESLKEVRSGNLYRVEKGVAELQDTFAEYANERISNKEDVDGLIKALPEEPSERISTRACGVAVICAAYAGLVVHNAAGITALVAAVAGAVITCGKWVGSPKQCKRSASLNHELEESYRKAIPDVASLAAEKA